MTYKCTTRMELEQENLIDSMELGGSQFDLLSLILDLQLKIFKERIKEEFGERAKNLTIDSDDLLREINSLN